MGSVDYFEKPQRRILGFDPRFVLVAFIIGGIPACLLPQTFGWLAFGGVIASLVYFVWVKNIWCEPQYSDEKSQICKAAALVILIVILRAVFTRDLTTIIYAPFFAFSFFIAIGIVLVIIAFIFFVRLVFYLITTNYEYSDRYRRIP